MKPIHFGIIGAGRMGNLHAENLGQIANATVAGVYDIDFQAARKISDKFGATIFESATELVEAPEIDCVLIASPTYCHIEAIRVAIAVKKDIFCEKPLVRNLEDAQEILELLENYPKLFTIGFVRRYMAKCQKVEQLLRQGVIGRLRYCNVDLSLGIFRRMPGNWFTDFSQSGGVIIDMLAHHVDLANWFFGDAATVYSAGLLLDGSQKLPADYAASVIKYKNGVICNMICSWQRFGRSCELMEIYGDDGALILDGTDNIAVYSADGEKRIIDIIPAEIPTGGVEQVNIGDGYQIEMKRLVAAVAGGDQTGMPTVADGLRSLELGLAMIESAQSGKAVKL